MPTGDNTWATPGRTTRVSFDVQEVVGTRPDWHDTRRGSQIQRMTLGSNTTSHVVLEPGDGWTLSPHNDDLGRIVTTTFGGGGLVLTGADVNLAPGYVGSVNQFRQDTDLPGVTPSASLLSAGVPAFVKRPAAGASWGQELVGDVAALPKPVEETADYKMLRVLSSNRTFHENAGFALLLAQSTNFSGIDTVARVYFGGPVQTLTPGVTGGQFSLTLRGNGEAILREFDGANWQYRMRFPWRNGSGQGNLGYYFIKVFPYGRDTIAFHTVDTSAILGTGGATLLPLLTTIAGHAIGAQQMRPGMAYYRNQATISGYASGLFATGVGPVRLDLRENLRPIVSLIHLKPSASGTLTDGPFWSPFPVPANTIIQIYADAVQPKDSSLTCTVYDASTNAPLVLTGSNQWKANAGQQAYYVVWSFNPDSAGEQTPALWSYSVRIAGAATVTRNPTSITGGNLRRVFVTGADLDPTHDAAQAEIIDAKAELTILQQRSRLHGRIGIYADNGALTSVLFEGEAQRADARQRGIPGRLYPSPNWSNYSISFTGMWARLADQVNLSLRNYAVDRSAPLNPATGQPPACKVTDVIRDLLTTGANLPLSMIDVPDIDIRLGPTTDSSGDQFLLRPGASIAEHILTLARDYLGLVFTWDPNAGSLGMWRLLPNPNVGNGPFLASFVGGPSLNGSLAHRPESYPAGTTFIETGTLNRWVQAPECNYVLVLGAGGVINGDGTLTKTSAAIYNPISFDFVGATSDPTHQDYLGRFVPAIYVNPSLTTANLCALVARRIYDVACHARKWVRFQAPLMLVTNAADALQTRPRPLRVNDQVYVLGAKALVRSCNPEYEHDGYQKATYECVLI